MKKRVGTMNGTTSENSCPRDYFLRLILSVFKGQRFKHSCSQKGNDFEYCFWSHLNPDRTSKPAGGPPSGANVAKTASIRHIQPFPRSQNRASLHSIRTKFAVCESVSQRLRRGVRVWLTALPCPVTAQNEGGSATRGSCRALVKKWRAPKGPPVSTLQITKLAGVSRATYYRFDLEAVPAVRMSSYETDSADRVAVSGLWSSRATAELQRQGWEVNGSVFSTAESIAASRAASSTPLREMPKADLANAAALMCELLPAEFAREDGAGARDLFVAGLVGRGAEDRPAVSGRRPFDRKNGRVADHFRFEPFARGLALVGDCVPDEDDLFEKLGVSLFEVGEGAPAAKKGGSPLVGVVIGQPVNEGTAAEHNVARHHMRNKGDAEVDVSVIVYLTQGMW